MRGKPAFVVQESLFQHGIQSRVEVATVNLLGDHDHLIEQYFTFCGQLLCQMKVPMGLCNASSTRVNTATTVVSGTL